jgi:hypothetical protein
MATDVYARWRRHQRGAQELSFCFCALEFVLLDLCHSAHLKQVQNITHNMILCALELDHSLKKKKKKKNPLLVPCCTLR